MSKQSTQSHNGNILVVDDLLQNLRLLVGLLKNHGYHVRAVSEAHLALNSVQREPPDVILLDIRMPDLSGYEICERLKADARTCDIPVIFITALDDMNDKIRGFAVGGVDYITKPFAMEEVLARVKTHLTIRKQQLQLQEAQQRWQALASAAFEGILLHAQGAIVDVNQACETLFGYPHAELLGKQALDLFTRESQAQALTCLTADTTQPVQVWGQTRTGVAVSLEIQTKTVLFQEQALRVLAIRDLSWRSVLAQAQRSVRLTLDEQPQFGGFIGKSQVMQTVYDYILRAAAVDAPVMIYGETGTGKELAARTIFELSTHHTRQFVAVNCAAIPENLFESAFFGYRKGAFTGADRDTTGYFEQAHGGTLFLDEVGELPLPMQAKLLRVLENHTYTPIGMNASRPVDVRILAATNHDLRQLVRQRKVRGDFFYRLHVIAIDLPPLRWRKEDLPLLCAYFLNAFTPPERAGLTLPDVVLERFQAYDWPGNVRELANEVRRYLTTGAVELSGSGPIPDQLPVTVPTIGFPFPDDLPLSDAVEEFERAYIPRVLNAHHFQKGKTAEVLGINRKTLYEKLKKYGE